jgi:hypothetical protein
MTQLRSVMAVATVPSFAPPPRANGRSSTRLHSGGARRLIEATSSRPLVPWPQAPLHGLVSFLPGRPRKVRNRPTSLAERHPSKFLSGTQQKLIVFELRLRYLLRYDGVLYKLLL